MNKQLVFIRSIIVCCLSFTSNIYGQQSGNNCDGYAGDTYIVLEADYEDVLKHSDALVVRSVHNSEQDDADDEEVPGVGTHQQVQPLYLIKTLLAPINILRSRTLSRLIAAPIGATTTLQVPVLLLHNEEDALDEAEAVHQSLRYSHIY